MSTRAPISKRIRFEVFKRDGFTCVYCGAQPPKAILHCDHVVAVANEGTNDIDNLVTACDVCNMGKGARELNAVPLSVDEKAAILREREEQIRAFNLAVSEKLARIEDSAWAVADILIEAWGEDGIRRDWFTSIERFVGELPLDEVIEAAKLATTRMRFSKRKCFLYFCGICWRKIRRARGEEIEPEGE
jgi:hypothetical protein